MATLSLKQLLTPITVDQALASVLGTLQSFGFQSTSWQSGSKQLTLVQTFAKVYSDLTYTIADITRSGFAKLAQDAYQDLLGQYTFKLTRIAATPALGQMVFKSSPGAPIANWTDGSLLISDKPPGSDGANLYTVVGAGTLNPNATATVNVRATGPGSAANIAPNVTLYLWTPLVGVSVTNPPITGTSTWITTPGTDSESNERYGDRMVSRWSALTYGNTDGAYRYWALTALPALTRVTIVRNPDVPAAITVVGATATGGLSGGQITTIADYINGITDNVGRRPINDVLTVSSAVVNNSPTLNITITVASQYATTIAAQATAALIAYFGTLPLGGTRIPPNTQGYVLVAGMYQTLMGLTGVINVSGLPSADIQLGALDIYSPTINVTVVSV